MKSLTEAAMEAGQPSCLLCLQWTVKGNKMLCRKHPRVREYVANVLHPAVALRRTDRASRCNDYDPEEAE